MVDNPMLFGWDDPPEWKQVTAWYCEICEVFSDGPSCECPTEEYHGGEVDAVICPDCDSLVLDNDDALDAHCKSDCDRYFDEPDFYLWD